MDNVIKKFINQLKENYFLKESNNINDDKIQLILSLPDLSSAPLKVYLLHDQDKKEYYFSDNGELVNKLKGFDLPYYKIQLERFLVPDSTWFADETENHTYFSNPAPQGNLELLFHYFHLFVQGLIQVETYAQMSHSKSSDEQLHDMTKPNQEN